VNKIAKFLKTLLDSPSTQPLLTLWILGGINTYAMVSGWINTGVGFLVMIGVLIVLILAAFRKDLEVVHDLVNSTNDRMVNRITQLTKALENSGTSVPPEPIIPPHPKAGEQDE